MTPTEVVDQRRIDISAFVSEHPTIDLSDVKIISDKLEIPYLDVQNDVKFLKEKKREDYKKYNIEGLRDKARKHVVRLDELRKAAAELVKSEDKEIKLKAINTEVGLIHTIYSLENDGIGEMTEEINGKEDGLANKKKQTLEA